MEPEDHWCKMVNGNYALYGDRPSSESETIDDHVARVHPNDYRSKRKVNRTATDLEHSLSLAQLENDTDSVKYEKKVKEPRLLRYVSSKDIEENFVAEKFESYDLKTEERPRRYAFTKKPKNPADGSVNYAYSRSSSGCSSPSGNLPTISEHGEQYATYRVRNMPAVEDILAGYDTKLDKYFSKPRDVNPFTLKGSHPDSLYRVSADCETPAGKVARVMRVLRWPIALLTVCLTIAIFVYFLMPYNTESNSTNGTYWTPVQSSAIRHPTKDIHTPSTEHKTQEQTQTESTITQGTNSPEIDFYEARKMTDAKPTSEKTWHAQPVFPEHISPEVQYGNEKADTDKLRTPKVLTEGNNDPYDSTLKPHITQKPEKPLAIYFKEVGDSSSTESITIADIINSLTKDGKQNDKSATLIGEDVQEPPNAATHPDPVTTPYQEPELVTETEAEPTLDTRGLYPPLKQDAKFTSGHSNFFGLSIEDAERMKSTTQSSIYNTRVSPTLPTWRDGDDTTTKRYPTNSYLDVQCRSTHMPFCRGILPYDLAGAPTKLNGVEISSFMPQIEALLATNCSERVHHYFCALLEPECSAPPHPNKMPCKNFCKVIAESCAGQIPRELFPAFNCNQYLVDNCIDTRTNNCYPDEFTCGDGSCVPNDWTCDGRAHCPNGEDEAMCNKCARNEFRCPQGACIQKSWWCDGYSDCANGEDELNCAHVRQKVFPRGQEGELGEASAPAPTYRRPQRPAARRQYTTTSADDGQELLVASDSKHALTRNFTRRPSPARLSHYSRQQFFNATDKQRPARSEIAKASVMKPSIDRMTKLSGKSLEEGSDDPGFLDASDITTNLHQNDTQANTNGRSRAKSVQRVRKPNKVRAQGAKPTYLSEQNTESYYKPVTKFERVIDGAGLLKKAATEAALEAEMDNVDAVDENSSRQNIKDLDDWSEHSHSSPCPAGELRCVDGRCITLAHLCDGTVDCSDHADEDNCFS